MALDSLGYPHISYYDFALEDLKYARWDGTAWHIESVDTPGEVGLSTSLALDGNDRPHISYRDVTVGTVKYAHWSGSNWQLQIIDTNSGFARGQTSLALDGAGFPRIAFGDGVLGDLILSSWDGGAWQTQTVGPGGGYVSLAIDSTGTSHLAYSDTDFNSSEVLMYATWTGAFWQIQNLDTGYNFLHPSLALDVADYPHITYNDTTVLKHTWWTGITWQNQSISTALTGPYQSALKIDSFGDLHISYNRTSNGLTYARWDGAAWLVRTVDTAYAAGHLSMVLDASNNPHFSYQQSNAHLKYARPCQ